MSRRAFIVNTAPPAPPCFPSRLEWIEWLVSAAQADDRTATQSVIVLLRGQSVRLRLESIDYCEDCTAAYKAQQQRLGRCDPQWLKRMNGVDDAATA